MKTREKVFLGLALLGILGIILGITDKNISLFGFYLIWFLAFMALFCISSKFNPFQKKSYYILLRHDPSQPIDPDRDYKGNRIDSYVDSYTVIDLETTGLSPHSDQIIELSAVRVRNGKVVDTFSSLVNPQIHIPSKIESISGINDSMVAEAPVISEILGQYLDFIGKDVVLGHNVHFDVNFIYDNSIKVFQKPFTNNFIDTLYLSRKILPDLEHHKLSDIAAYYNIKSDNAHRAYYDCLTTNSIYRKMFNEE